MGMLSFLESVARSVRGYNTTLIVFYMVVTALYYMACLSDGTVSDHCSLIGLLWLAVTCGFVFVLFLQGFYRSLMTRNVADHIPKTHLRGADDMARLIDAVRDSEQLGGPKND